MCNIVKCPKCGGQLIYETFGQYGRAHKVTSNGHVCKRSKMIDYGMSDVLESMLYCSLCGWEARGQFGHDGESVMLIMDEEGEDKC